MLPWGLTAGFAAGAVLHLLLVVLVWSRPARQGRRRLDRLFLALFSALLLWHGGNLLALYLAPFHGEHRGTLLLFARGLAFAGLSLLPPLLAEVHLAYARLLPGGPVRMALYLPLAAAPWGVRAAAGATGIPQGPWTTGFILYFCAALAVAIAVNIRLARRAVSGVRLMRVLHVLLAAFFGALTDACTWAFLLAPGTPALE